MTRAYYSPTPEDLHEKKANYAGHKFEIGRHFAPDIEDSRDEGTQGKFTSDVEGLSDGSESSFKENSKKRRRFED